MIADTRYVQIDLPTIMKGFGYLAHRTADEATENATVPSGQDRVSVKRLATMLLVAAILPCIHREISGTSDGSLLSVFTGYAGDTVCHLVSALLNRHP